MQLHYFICFMTLGSTTELATKWIKDEDAKKVSADLKWKYSAFWVTSLYLEIPGLQIYIYTE